MIFGLLTKKDPGRSSFSTSGFPAKRPEVTNVKNNAKQAIGKHRYTLKEDRQAHAEIGLVIRRPVIVCNRGSTPILGGVAKRKRLFRGAYKNYVDFASHTSIVC